MSTVSFSTVSARKRRRRLRQARRRSILAVLFLSTAGLLSLTLFSLGSVLAEHFSHIPLPPDQTPSFSAQPTGQAEQEELQDWRLVLVNANHPLEQNYMPELTTIDASGRQVDARIAGDLKRMLQDMEREGLSPLVCSAYRNWDRQNTLFQAQLNKQKAQGLTGEEAAAAASAIVAAPGTSEHQLGLAVDIVSLYDQVLDDGQERTPEAQWLKEHCWQYGFILRYPPKLSHRTGVIYEPWHYRYVGVEAAKEIMSQEICLEDYLNI